jgi:pyruvate/2-oxoglutarate dehydrogenase complex dihydrolipoamide dehydrogenase (E3) component
MAKAGQSVAVVERKLIGGSCPNIACLPSKNNIHSAKVAQFVHRAGEFGIKTGDVTIDMTGVRTRKRKMVDGEIRVHLEPYKASGAELIMGEAHFIAPKTVEVRSNDGTVRILSGNQVVLNLGTHAAIPDIPGLKAVKPMTHIEALELERLPEHLVVLGGGFVGLETCAGRFGSRVTILERGQQLIGREDPDVAEAILYLFYLIPKSLTSKACPVRGSSCVCATPMANARWRAPISSSLLDGFQILKVLASRRPALKPTTEAISR